MHIVKIIVYGKLNLVNIDIILNGLFIAAAMIAGNYTALKLIKDINRKKYQKIVAGCMIVLSLYLFISNFINS